MQSVFSRTSNALTRENSVLLNQQLELAVQVSIQLFHHLIPTELIWATLSECRGPSRSQSFRELSQRVPSSSRSVPAYIQRASLYKRSLNAFDTDGSIQHADPTRELWRTNSLERRPSISHISPLPAPASLSFSDLTTRAFRSTAPAVDLPRIDEEEEVCVALTDIEPAPVTLGREKSYYTETNEWWAQLDRQGLYVEEDQEDPVAQVRVFRFQRLHNDAHCLRALQPMSSGPSTPPRSSPTPHPASAHTSPTQLPVVLPSPPTASRSLKYVASPSPSVYSAAESDGSEDEDEYMPSLSPRKRFRRSVPSAGAGPSSSPVKADSTDVRPPYPFVLRSLTYSTLSALPNAPASPSPAAPTSSASTSPAPQPQSPSRTSATGTATWRPISRIASTRGAPRATSP